MAAIISSITEGDGYLDAKKKRNSISSISKKLIKDVQLALLKLDFPSTYSCIPEKTRVISKGKLSRCKESYSLSWSYTPHRVFQDNDFYYLKVTSVKEEPYDDYVYNIGTENQEYLLPYIVQIVMA